MGDSSIEWTEKTWNPVVGCSKVSPGCAHCYAEFRDHRLRGFAHEEWKAWTPENAAYNVRLHPERLLEPLRTKKPATWFVNSMSDLFHELVPFEFIDRVFAVMALTPQHTYQVLTKRPERMREYCAGRNRGYWLDKARTWAAVEGWPVRDTDDRSSRRRALPNVWLGTSVENQHWADVRIPELLATPAAVRFLSCEPLLGPLDLGHMGVPFHLDGVAGLYSGIAPLTGRSTDMGRPCPDAARIDWLIVGGESGGGARACDLAWIRGIVEQCRSASVAVFVKQLGSVAIFDRDEVREGARFYEAIGGMTSRQFEVGLHGKGGDMEEWPPDLRVREMPLTAVGHA